MKIMIKLSNKKRWKTREKQKDFFFSICLGSASHYSIASGCLPQNQKILINFDIFHIQLASNWFRVSWAFGKHELTNFFFSFSAEINLKERRRKIPVRRENFQIR